MSERPEHLQPSYSDRGFGRLPEIPGAYGETVRTYESSAAMSPHIWLAVEAPMNPNHPDEGTLTAHIHLTAANAVMLAEQLQYLVANHYQETP